MFNYFQNFQEKNNINDTKNVVVKKENKDEINDNDLKSDSSETNYKNG